MSIINHDFGSGTREKERRFRRLLGLDALHEANVRANPLPYLERASERIFQLEKALFEAAEAGRPQHGAPASQEVITVNNAQYGRLLQCHAIIEKALAELGSSEI